MDLNNVCANTIPCSFAALTHSSSITLPLSTTRYLTPLFCERCTLSGNGKNTSLEHATPSNYLPTPSFPPPTLAPRPRTRTPTVPPPCLQHFSSDKQVNGICFFCVFYYFTCFLKWRARMHGWWRSHQRLALACGTVFTHLHPICLTKRMRP